MRLIKRRTWLVILALAAALHFVWFGLVDLKQTTRPPAARPDTRFTYGATGGEADEAVQREEAELLDSAPLFMPTGWNYASSVDDVANLQRAAEPYRTLPPQLALREPEATRPRPPIAPERDALWAQTAPSARERLRSMGQDPRPVPRLASRLPQVEVTDLETGQIVYQGELPAAYSQLAKGDWWNPFSALLLVAPSGRWGRPFRTGPTGENDFDEALHRYLQSEELLRNLPAGYFRVAIAP
ncbi:MAG: hypothetical protein Q7P63_10480 [Verrucomicrobiota bacterium JB022]|nr:hypothetical protein [Verrucomicrobiota bacterium JB022]